MKKIFSLILVVLVAAQYAAGQNLPTPALPPAVLNPYPGYFNITELTYDFGLGVTNDPNNNYDKSFVGLTTVNGYQINRLFTAGGGTGLLFYGSHLLVPLYLSGRLTYPVVNQKVSPYVNADAGALLNFSNFNKGTKFFINPVFGARMILSPTFAINAGVGYFAQMGPWSARDSFINLKFGIIIIPNHK